METLHAVKEYDLTADEERLMHMMKALGNPARMQIIRYLSQNPACITGDIVERLMDLPCAIVSIMAILIT